MRLKLFRIKEYLHSTLWAVPALCTGAAFALTHLLLAVDEAISQERHAWYLFGGGPDSARALLSTIAASMITFTGVVFSITMLVLQLASQQFSPRVLRSFLRDLNNQFVLGVFVATFTYALLVLRAVRSESASTGTPAFVPSLSIWVAILLIILSVGLFVHFINHMAQSIRAVSIITTVADETRQAIDRMYPEEIGDEPEHPVELPSDPPDLVVSSPGPPGVLLAVDEERILACAQEDGMVLALVPMVGDFIPEGAPLFSVWGRRSGIRGQSLRELVSIAPERTMEQDPLFGFRQLVDIAERALSPGINDPTTAVQVLDRLHDLLRRLAGRRFPSPYRLNGGGQMRVILPRPSWEDYVLLALDEIRQYGERSVQVLRRLRALLQDVREVAPPARRPVLEQQLALLDAAVTRGFDNPLDQRVSRQPSPQGHGPPRSARPDQASMREITGDGG